MFGESDTTRPPILYPACRGTGEPEHGIHRAEDHESVSIVSKETSRPAHLHGRDTQDDERMRSQETQSGREGDGSSPVLVHTELSVARVGSVGTTSVSPGVGSTWMGVRGCDKPL